MSNPDDNALVEVLASRSTDDEASALLDELSRLQHWCTLLMCRQVPGAIDAADLVQRTRVLIIERCKRATIRQQEANNAGR